MSLAAFKDRYPGIVERLRRTRLSNRVFHSWIFTGDHLSELNQLVYSWLQTCICEQPTENGDACDVCHSCQKLQKRTYVHLFEVKPASKSRQILVDEIRDLEHFLCLTTSGEIKIGLILEADRMSIQAQNAFLKTLEEPVSKTLIILVTQNPEGLLPTIRSRCQMVSLDSNRYRYDFSGREDLFKLLASMGKGKGAMIAVSAAEEINGMLTNLRNEAELLIKKRKNTYTSSYSDVGKEVSKKHESVMQAEVTSHYLYVRGQVTSAIHSWYGQEFLRANGIPIGLLPHPEFYAGFSDNFRSQTPSTDEALWALGISDSLIGNLTLNVNEQLALQEFCYRLCAKGNDANS